ncbi:sodium:proton antiporter [Paenibacillus yonginensis]|uniref:Sodium:proton antiporter n=1 Tax=Paenibacillus yonginensis TaxID=1462996 RepID=A0A1B1MW74_9BACL|nr:cation:proton antiporter [Paenibacillus yonginensis]ANS73432.1 sodium:proton antiporter [Paenibacillus yonginensis]
MEFVLTLCLILIVTKLAGHAAARLGQPSVLGKLISGIIVGPAVLGWVQDADWIHIFSEIGVLLLMFIAGLETDLKQLKENWKTAVAVALGGILMPLFGGYAAALAFGLSQSHALFLGLLLSATSVSITVQSLKEMDRLKSREGSAILGAAVIDDVVVVLLLAFMLSFLGAGSGGDSLLWITGKKLIFFGVSIAAAWLLVPLVMKLFGRLKVTETAITAGLIVCFGFSYFAEMMGVAGIIGAFIAGIAVAVTPSKHKVEARIEPIAYALFVPVFFVSIGLKVSFEGVLEQLGIIVVLSIVAILTKWIGGGLGAKLTGFSLKSSSAIGAGMVSRGEVALILAATGLASSLLDEAYFTAVVIVVMITTLVTPPLLKATFPRGEDRERQPQTESNKSKQTDH